MKAITDLRDRFEHFKENINGVALKQQIRDSELKQVIQNIF